MPGRSSLDPLAHRAARSAAPLGDDLGHDRQGRLGRRPPAQVEAHRTTQLVELGVAQARLAQPYPAVALGLARAHRPDIAGPAVERLDDRRLVELDVMGQDGYG